MGRKRDVKPWDTKDYLEGLYTSENLSTREITKRIEAEFNTKTHANTIRRALIRHLIPLRTKSEAQTLFLTENDHPMLGRERTDEEKLRISEGIQKAWDELDDATVAAKKEDMAERARDRWESMTEDEQRENVEKMHQANREKSGQGSKNENMVATLLGEAGFKFAQRTRRYSPGQKFEIDIAIPSEAIAVEWDGAAHFLPIYGQKDLDRTMEKDARKDKALLSNHWTVVRVRDHSTSHSLAFCRRAVDDIIEFIDSGVRGIVHIIEAK